MKTCEKCSGTDISTTFIAARTTINTSSVKRVETEFIESSEYTHFFKLTAKKEHLRFKCLICGYRWREQVLSDKTT